MKPNKLYAACQWYRWTTNHEYKTDQDFYYYWRIEECETHRLSMFKFVNHNFNEMIFIFNFKSVYVDNLLCTM